MWKGGFDGRCLTKEEFTAHVASLKWTAWRPKFCVTHNTGSPSLKQWMATPGGESQRIKNLAHYYRDQNGWAAGPHGFVSPSGIFLGTPLTSPGVHSPSWNSLSIGLEMAGDYDTEPFDDRVRDNAIHFMAAIHAALGISPVDFKLGIRGLHFHREDPKTTHKHCPGKNVIKPEFVKRVQDAIAALHPGEHRVAV